MKKSIPLIRCLVSTTAALVTLLAAVALPAGATEEWLVAAQPRPISRGLHESQTHPPQVLPSLRKAAQAGPFAPTAEPSLEGSPVEYLILTHSDYAGQFQRLADWKTAKGVPSVVRTLDDVNASAVTGSDLAEKIRHYIRNAYQYWGVRYVLLGGDHDVIPVRYVQMEFLGLEQPLSELYYSCLSGNWNADGDAHFGEAFVSSEDPGDDVDFTAEVYLGRAPVNTIEESQVFVDKTLMHEFPTVRDFQDELLILAEVLFPPNYEPDGTPPSGDGAIYAEEVYELMPAEMSAQRLYEASEFWAGSQSLTVEASVNAINVGYGTVLHVGHGYRYTLSTGDGSLDVSRAAAFSNGARAGLFYLLNCTAAAFDFESMAETILLNPTGGATVVVGAAREAFPLASRDYQRAFFEKVWVEGEHRVGVAMTESRELFLDSVDFASVDRWTQFVYTLLGDPELPLWTSVREELQIVDLPSSLPLGGATVTLTIHDQNGVLPDALVCAQKLNEEYQFGRTDTQGQITFDLQTQTVGDMQFTVTARNQLPWQVSVPVETGSVNLVLESQALIDDGAGSGNGNLDLRLDAGETVRLQPILSNQGSQTATGLSATLVSQSADITVLQAASSYPDLAQGGSSGPGTDFIVQVAPDAQDGAVEQLRLEIQDGQSTWTRRVDLLLHAPRLLLRSLRWDDSRAGNGDGIFEANEEIDLFYSIENIGSGTATDVTVELSQADPGLELLSTTASLPGLAPGQVLETQTPLTIRETDVGTSRTAHRVLQDAWSTTNLAQSIELRFPAPPSDLVFAPANASDITSLAWSPSGEADLLGYNVYRSQSISGPFVQINDRVVGNSYFRDTGLEANQRYHYVVTALDVMLNESVFSEVGSISTNPPQLSGWPLSVDGFTASTPAIGDIDADGGLDVVAAARQVYVWDASGDEHIDADQSALTWGVFYGDEESFSSIAVGDLDPLPGQEIVTVSWDPERRFVVVLTAQGEVLPGWPQPLAPAPAAYNGASVPPVIANIDGNGAPEIFVAARDGKVYAWHADGSEVADGDDDPSTHGVFLNTGSPFLRSAPGIADIDPATPGWELAVGSTNGFLHLVAANGEPIPGWPRSTYGEGSPFGVAFTSGISIADIDRDGTKEMIFTEIGHRLHAMHVDGSEVAGFPVSNIISSSPAVTPSPAIGDLLGDSNLEIVVATSTGEVDLIDAQGQSLLDERLKTHANSESSPILGDIDGDGEIEILLGNEEGFLHAWNLDGSTVDGFPIVFGAEVRGTPSLADLDGDGSVELVVQAWDGLVRIFDLAGTWQEALFPWPTDRGSSHRTGEFGFEVPTPVVVSDLQGSFEESSGVRLIWRALADQDGSEAIWRIYRSGPHAQEPVADGPPDRYTEPIGEISGTGDLEFVDPDAIPGSWYVYNLGMLELRLGETSNEVLVARIAVDTRIAIPKVLRFLPNVPNPFNPRTRIRFEVPARRGASRVAVDLRLYDAHGRIVRTLWQGELPPGRHHFDWDGLGDTGRPAASGVYFAHVVSQGWRAMHKITLLR